MMRDEVVVVGAGWAGLSAAVRLTQAGMRVRLLDSAPQPGGRAREVRLDFDAPGGPRGVVLDAGQHLLVGAYRECLELASLVHDGKPPIERSRLALCDTAGLRIVAAALPAPFHLLLAMLRADGLRAFERWSAIRLVGALRAQRWRAMPGETVDALLARHGQPASLVERLWSPLCVAALNTGSDIACAAAFAAVLRDTLGAEARASDFVLPRATLGGLIGRPALEWLRSHGADISLATTLRSLSALPGAGFRLRLDRGEIHATQLVLATPPWVSARLLAPLSGLAAGFERFTYDAIGTVYLAWAPSHAPAVPRWIMLRESIERRQHGQWLFDRGLHQGHRICAVVVSAHGRLGKHPVQEIAEGIATQVREQLAVPQPTAHRTVTEKRATYRCVPDRPRIPVDFFAHALPGLWLAGDYVDAEYPATLESAVRSGRKAAGLAAASRAVAARNATTPDRLQSQAASSA